MNIEKVIRDMLDGHSSGKANLSNSGLVETKYLKQLEEYIKELDKIYIEELERKSRSTAKELEKA